MRNFQLVRIGFHYDGFTLVKSFSHKSVCLPPHIPLPPIQEIVDAIIEAEPRLERSWLSVRDAAGLQSLKNTYSSSVTYPNEKTNDFVKNANIVLAFDIDADESDEYFLVEV